MKKFLGLTLVLALSCGCIKAAVRAPEVRVHDIRKIAVVPMEAPPLEVVPSAAGGVLAGAGPHLVMAPEGLIRTGGKAGVMVFGIFMLMELPAAAREAAKKAESLEGMLGSGKAWAPTADLAEDAAGRIAPGGIRDAVVERKIQKYPGIANRERTILLENWQAPMREWYGLDVSPFDYRAYREQGVDAVLEIGLLNYALYGDHLILQVMLKLVDPATGRVLGRSRQTETARIERPASLFEENGRPFKELFGQVGGNLVEANLKGIGFLAD